MAYGMLTSFALGAAQGLGSAIVNKYSKDQDAEIAAKAAADRESRIEEAAIRAEGRAVTLAEKNYNRLRADTVNDREIKRGEEMVDQQFKINEEERKLTETRAYENRTDTLAGQAKVAQISAATASNESQRLELETKRKILEAGVEWEKATTPQAKQAAEDKVKALTGKIEDGITLETSRDIIGYDEKGNAITSSTMMWVDKRHQTVTPVDTGKTALLSDAQVKSEAKASSAAASVKANAVGGTNYTGYQDVKPHWYDTDAQKEELRRKEKYNKVYTETLYNGVTGMIGDKTTDKAIEQAVKTATANPLIKFDDPVKQGQFDTINGVILFSESSTKGADVGKPKPTANNPNPTADGSYQITNIAMKDLEIPPDLPNGEYSVASKEKAAPKYYQKAYDDTQGDASAYLAYRFAPTDIKQAVAKAKEKGGYWWEYAKSDFTKENMPTVIRDAELTMVQLGIENKPIPSEIQKLLLANK